MYKLATEYKVVRTDLKDSKDVKVVMVRYNKEKAEKQAIMYNIMFGDNAIYTVEESKNEAYV